VRVALVHDWLTGMRGGEKVLDAICELYPDAPLYTLVRRPGSTNARIESRPIRTSLAQWLPRPARFYRHYLPLYPTLVELLDFDQYDLVISTSHCAVKSIVVPGRAVHVCYCHSPMRYAWDQFNSYFGPQVVGGFASRIMKPIMARMARWDAATAGRVDRFVANSQYVAGRISRYYNQRSTVVYPPVDTDYYRPEDDQRRPTQPSFLVVSALVPYKRVDVAVEACRRAGVRLRIAGSGPEQPRLEKIAGPDVEFLGWRQDADVRELYRQSTAVIMPGVEDFGMVPVEAQACGIPVVALNEGGARESVLHDRTGVLVSEPGADAFADALNAVANRAWDRHELRANALRFSRERFFADFRAVVSQAVHDKTRTRNVSTSSATARPGHDAAV
jgi:glycosyltransferase involved in cell wall biosynthesis